MQKKRGQAAMEFLMTYGWAILAAIIAIGVLAYFGVFSPQNLAGSSGLVNAPFVLDAFNVLDSGDTVNFELTQNSGETLTVHDLTLTGTGPFSQGTCTNAAGTLSFTSGVQQTVTLTCSGQAIASGDSVVGDIRIIYTKSGSSLNQTSTGSLRDTAQ